MIELELAFKIEVIVPRIGASVLTLKLLMILKFLSLNCWVIIAISMFLPSLYDCQVIRGFALFCTVTTGLSTSVSFSRSN